MNKHVVCTCAPFLTYAQCEHVLFVESLSVPGRPATSDLSTLPSQRKRGRPVGSGSVVRGKKQAKRSGSVSHGEGLRELNVVRCVCAALCWPANKHR